MSFRVSGYLHNPINLGLLADHMTVGIQAAAAQTAREGLDYLRSNTPRETDALAASEQSGSNQYSVWFQASVQPRGDGRPYGAAQNNGWHDRGGGWHPGDHFMERTQEWAAERLRALVALIALNAGASRNGGIFQDDGALLGPDILFGGLSRIISTSPGEIR